MRTTVYDDDFRTLAQKTPRVFISLIKVELPLSCVLYLRSSKSTPESLSIRICQEDRLVDLKEAFDKVNEYLFKGYPDITEEVEKIMGGNVYVTRSEILRKEGRIEGAIKIMLGMNCSEDDIVSQLMKTFDLSEADAKAHYDEYMG